MHGSSWLAGVLFVVICQPTAIVSSAKLRRRTTANDRTPSKSNAEYHVKLDNYNNVQYSASLTVGNQVLPVIYDTGSFEIIVLSTLCKSCYHRGHVMYDRLKSSSFVPAEGVVAEHLFVSGPIVSEKGYETVRIGSPDSPYMVGYFPFWQVVSHELEIWNRNAHFSGIVGMGHPNPIPEGYSAEGDNEKTVLAGVNVNSFSLCLERSENNAPGWMFLGPDNDEMTRQGLFSAVPVVGHVHWGVKLTNFYVPSVSEPNPCVPSCGAIIDSGTSFIAVPPGAYRYVWRLSQMIASDCSNLNDLPYLSMKLGDVTIALPPRAYVVEVENDAPENSTIRRRLVEGGAKKCRAAFMSLDKMSQVGPVWILGMPFLRYYHTIFNRATKQVFVRRSTPSCTMPGPNMSQLFNTSNVSSSNDSHQHVHFAGAFTAADYKPTKVDLNDVRMPAWAMDDSGQLSHNFVF